MIKYMSRLGNVVWAITYKRLILIDVSHSGINIVELIESVVFKFCLKDKIFSVTLDNVSSNTSALSNLIQKFAAYLGPDPEPLDNGPDRDIGRALRDLLHSRCDYHIINLNVKSGLKRIKVYHEAFRTALSFFELFPPTYCSLP